MIGTIKIFGKLRDTTLRDAISDKNYDYMIGRHVEFCDFENGKMTTNWFDVLADNLNDGEKDFKVVFAI